MFLDFFNELLNDTSPLYFYISIAFSIIYFDRFQVHPYRKLYENELFLRKQHEVNIQSLPVEETISTVLEFRVWFIRNTKRIEAPDDDEDPTSFSFKNNIKKRGGKTWIKQQHLYSLSLKNTVLF